ncbi:MAG: STAS/SEC14 domain-containing protein [Thiolinea sp.]
MIDIDIGAEQAIVTLRPHGRMSEQDFEQVSQALGDYMNTHDHAPALLVQADQVPQWDSIAALMKHLKTVGTFHNLLPKVAIVSDSTVLSIMPTLADLLTKAKIRHFSNRHLQQAQEWAAAAGDDPGSFEVMEGLPHNVIGFGSRASSPRKTTTRPWSHC